MVRDFQRVNETSEIRKLLRVLGQDFTLSQNVNSRKGGLIGLAAIAIALGKVSICIRKLFSVVLYINLCVLMMIILIDSSLNIDMSNIC